MEQEEKYIYYCAEVQEWEKYLAQGFCNPSSLTSQGYIHCAFYDQLQLVYDTHFKDINPYLILKIDTVPLGDKVKVEKQNDGFYFPHVYEAIPISAIEEVTKVDLTKSTPIEEEQATIRSGLIPPMLIDYTKFKIIYTDSLTTDWENNWYHDTDADIVNNADGMMVSTNEYIDVVWFKYKIPKDFLITFEATFIPTGRSLSSVRIISDIVRNGLDSCVVYLHANAIPPKPGNLEEWSKERYDGNAPHYQEDMSNVRITFLSTQETVRFCVSPKCEKPNYIPVEDLNNNLKKLITDDNVKYVNENGYLAIYNDENIFTSNESLYYEIQKIGLDLLFRVTNMKTKVGKVFTASLKEELPGDEGYFAFSLMNRSDMQYKNFRVHHFDNGASFKDTPSHRA
jgi:uncharacterized protein (DUF952 family)